MPATGRLKALTIMEECLARRSGDLLHLMVFSLDFFFLFFFSSQDVNETNCSLVFAFHLLVFRIVHVDVKVLDTRNAFLNL